MASQNEARSGRGDDTTAHASTPDTGGRAFADWVVGERFRHPRGITVTEFAAVGFTQIAMNTAQGHFNEDLAKTRAFGTRITFGGITAAIVLGLTVQHTAGAGCREARLHRLRLPVPVFIGDTLYAYTEVSAKEPTGASGDRAGGVDGLGSVTFQHWGLNQAGDVVFECFRDVLVPR